VKLPKLQIDFDWSLVVIPLVLITAGIATLYSITTVTGRTTLAHDQIIYAVLAIALYVFFAALDYRALRSYSWYLYIVGLILLIAVNFFGQEIFGSRRWIELGFAQFQPSEVMKLVILVLGANFFAQNEDVPVRKTIFFLLLAAIPLVLILRQPDLGTALAISAMLVGILTVAKIPRKVVLILVALLVAAAPLAWFNLKSYQKERVVSFLEPAKDPRGSGYNVSQAKIAVGSGGIYGKGFGGTTQSQLQFLPVAHIDFIFSGWAEATGFIGSSLLVAAFAVLVARIYQIANSARDRFGYIFSTGAATLIFFQVLVNIGMNIGLMPVTGIPLPFVSYGGTSLLTSAMILGVVQSIYLRRKSLKFD